MEETHAPQQLVIREKGQGGEQVEGPPPPRTAEAVSDIDVSAPAVHRQQQKDEEDVAAQETTDNPTPKETPPAEQPHPQSQPFETSSSTTGEAAGVPAEAAEEAATGEGAAAASQEKSSPADSNSSSTASSSSSGARGPSADAKQRARLKRQFVRNQWLDINKAPSWPPIKKNRYLESDWQSVDFRPQVLETKKSRLFLNSLCYLCDGVITKKSTLGRRAGLGLFCERSEGFAKGAVITEFVGWLVDREQAEQLRKRRRASHIVAVQKGFLYIDGVKDPYYGTGGASFANDGSEFLGGPGNNSYFYHWFDEEIGRTRVFLRATRRIENGEEIFVPYDKNYWQDNFEEQEDNCPDAFRKRKIEQLQKKYNDYTITSMEDLKARQALLEKKKQEQQKRDDTRKKPKKHNIKRPLTAYMRFSVSRRKEIVEKEPEMRHPSRFKEVAQRISQEWKELNVKRKREIEKEAAADLAKYKQKVQDWKSKHLPKRKKKGRKATRTAATDTPPAAAVGGGNGAAKDKTERKKEQQEREKTTEGEANSEAPEAANAATDVPESSDEISDNSRQSSAPEAVGRDTQENKTEEPLAAAGVAAEAASATTVA